MRVHYSGIDVEWIVACLAPGDVAPHPNFQAEAVRPAELLALLVQHEFSDYEHYLEIFKEQTGHSAQSEANDDASIAFVLAAHESLIDETVASGLDKLIQFARSYDLTVGQRTAAALLASLGGSDQDVLPPCMDALTQIRDELAGLESTTSGSLALARCVVGQQAAIRALELGNSDEAKRASRYALAQSLQARGADEWETFITSQGISWSAKESQQRVLTMLEGSVRSLALSLRDELDDSWTEIVRATPPLAELRPTRDALSGLSSILEDTFKRMFYRESSRSVFRSRDPVHRLYASLTNAELSGSLSRITSGRRLLGQALAVRWASNEGEDHDQREAIRLLRQGDAEDDLRRLLYAIRVRGPHEVLRDAAVRLLHRPLEHRATPADLALIESAADLLDRDNLARATRLVLGFPENGTVGRLRQSKWAGWRRAETALKVASSVVGNSGLDEFGAATAMRINEEYKVTSNQIPMGALVRFLASLDWKSVSADTQEKWREIAIHLDPSSGILPGDAIRMARVVGVEPTTSVRDSLKGLERVAGLLNGWFGEQPGPLLVQECVDICAEMLRKIVEDAELGSYSGGGYSPTALAVHMIARHGQSGLWGPLIAALVHPAVAASEKIDALETLSELTFDIPDDVRERLAGLWPNLPGGFDLDFLRHSADLLPITWIEALLAHNIIGPGRVQAEIARYAASSSRDVRTRAAAATGAAARNDRTLVSEWPAVLLLQLSHDVDPLVRNSAARAASELSVSMNGPFVNAIRDRVIELLNDGGLGIIMGALRGFIDAGDRDLNGSLWCRAKVQDLAEAHPSANVRRAARAALERFK